MYQVPLCNDTLLGMLHAQQFVLKQPNKEYFNITILGARRLKLIKLACSKLSYW